MCRGFYAIKEESERDPGKDRLRLTPFHGSGKCRPRPENRGPWRASVRGKDRIVDSTDVARRNPEVIVASWCAKAMRKASITRRPGWQQMAAIRHDQVYKIKSTYILQPGPASLTEGLRQLHMVLARAAGTDPRAEHLATQRAPERGSRL